jgi:multidrug efflux pump subunit AcrB
MISPLFIDRPRLAVVIAIVISLAGLLALSRIPVAQLPDIVPPQVQVSATYPGASAAVLESAVAQPIGSKVIGVDKMIYMKSSSGADGSYNLTVSFLLGTDPDINTVNVNNRVQTAIANLPTEVQAQGLTVQKRSSSFLQFISLYSEGGKLDPLFITNYALINVMDELSRTPGVGQATLFGREDYSMRIWFDTSKLTSLGLAPSDVIRAVQAQNVQAPVGRIGARPVPEDQQFQLNLQTQGRLTTPEEFGAIVIRANPDGSVLQVKDVARIELGAQNQDTFSRLNGNPSVAIGMYLAPGANAITVSKAVNAALDKLRARFTVASLDQACVDKRKARIIQFDGIVGALCLARRLLPSGAQLKIFGEDAEVRASLGAALCGYEPHMVDMKVRSFDRTGEAGLSAQK